METTYERCGTPRGINAVKLSRITRSSKKTASESPLPGNNWPSEKLPQCHLRQTINANYGRDFNSDQNLKPPDIKSSDDSILNENIADHQINYPDYETTVILNNEREKSTVLPQDLDYKLEQTRQNVAPSSTYREDYPNTMNSSIQSPIYQLSQRQEQPRSELARGGMLGAIAAEQKLQKLKELQRKREFTERYYSHEIRKLITEYYKANSGNAGDSPQSKIKLEKPATDLPSPRQQQQQQQQQQQICTIGEIRPRNSSLGKPLEPCGTMTTITRLDCGCMQETTRPIFTTPEGRVENRNCRNGQDPAVLRLAPANPHEHLSASNCTENRGRLTLHSPSGPRLHRPGMLYPRIGTTRTSCPSKRTIHAANERCELGHRRTASFIGKIDSRIPETGSSSLLKSYREARNVSPLRKYSDTSTG